MIKGLTRCQFGSLSLCVVSNFAFLYPNLKKITRLKMPWSLLRPCLLLFRKPSCSSGE